MSHKMSDVEIQVALVDLPEWTVVDGKLHREYQFADFIHAFGFMATAAMPIEKMNHHPEWFNVYNRVEVDLTTHDAGGISAKDFPLATTLDQIARKLGCWQFLFVQGPTRYELLAPIGKGGMGEVWRNRGRPGCRPRIVPCDSDGGIA